MPFPPKTILVFCDGTGQDGLITDPKSVKAKDNHYTNVLRLSRAITKTFKKGSEERLQIVLYQSGVGVPLDFDAKNDLIDLKEKALGTAVASKIRDAYNFIAQNYIKGDQICIFGFSRGAYTARKLSGLIDRLGLLSPSQMGNFFPYWKQLNEKQDPGPPTPQEPVRIKCVGVWDTVGSVRRTENALKLLDNSLPSNVDIALHAIAFHENRDEFDITPYSDDNVSPNQVLKQVWFPGAHSDVGGGYIDHKLADITLAWMVGEITDFIGVDTDFLKAAMMDDGRDSEKPSDHWGSTTPNDAYQSTPILEGWGTVIWKKNRSHRLSNKSIVHPSLLISPRTSGLIDISELKKTGWSEEGHVVKLNAHEEQVKRYWFDQAKGGETPCFESPNEAESLF